MAKLPRVTFQTRYEHMIGLVNSSAKFVTDGWYTVLKTKHDALWFEVCNLDRDLDPEDDSIGDHPAYAKLYELFVDYAQSKLPADFFADIQARTQSAVTYLEVLQASMMDPSDEAAVWDAWDRQDAQSAFDEKYAMFMNEY